MKKGLTYISERTSQLRYADDREQEQWIQQLSTYIPLVKIKRGQPVSVATVKDLEIVSNGNEDLFNALKNSSDTYVVLTNPSRHSNTIGLALDYTDGDISFKNNKLETPDKIHIIGQGLYIEDKDYYAQAFTEQDTVDVSDEEYWPAFFDDYENSIGKKIYVKGDSDGELTLVKEEAYLAYNQVIVVGFVADANIKNGENVNHTGAIEVQIQGDDRGALDATVFEAVIGEDFYVGPNIVQANGESNCNTKVLALGKDDDEKFKFSFNFFENSDPLPRGFIAIQRIDGATAYICTNGIISEEDILNNEDSSLNTWSANDRAFVQVARYWSLTSGKSNSILGETEYKANKTVAPLANLDKYIDDAFKAVSAGPIVSLKDGVEHNANALTNVSTNLNLFSYVANDIGGSYEVYISDNLLKYVTALNITSRGSNYNKGYAVLADIRNKNRQNILGIYNSGHTGLIKQGTRAVFLSKGLFTDDSSPYEVGATYYLGSHGNIFKVPQEYYNSIIQIGYAQSSKTLIVNCADSRQYNNGDLPVGYMKPSIKGEAEFGFWLMDGVTRHKTSDAPTLLVRLKDMYDVSELDIRSYNFGSTDAPNYQESFIIPKVEFHSHFSDDNTTGYVPAQIKWLAEGVYKEMPRTPFIRRKTKIEKYTKDGVTYERAIIPDIDITSLLIYGPEEDRMQVPDLESLDIKLFVDVDKSNASRNWVQVDPGFHAVNNFIYYGFKWTVAQVDQVDQAHPYGSYVLRAVYSGTENEYTENVDENVLGICMQADPFAPPTSLAGFDAKVFVTKHDYYSRQFDAENLLKDFVKESVVDAADRPWEGSAVSGKAVRADIKRKVDTNVLAVSDEDNYNGTVDAYIKHIYLTSQKESTFESFKDRNAYFNDRLIQSDLRLMNPNKVDTYTVDYFNGTLGYGSTLEELDKTALESRIRNNDTAFLPYFIFKEHENEIITDEVELAVMEADDLSKYPHGIKNEGFHGTINARQLQGAYLGYGEYVFSQNADETSNTEDTGKNVGSINITIPYTQKYNNKYITRIGNVIKQYHGTVNVETTELNYDASTKTLTKKHTLPLESLYYKENFGGVTIKADIANSKFQFLKGNSDIEFAEIEGVLITPSRMKYKYLLHSYDNVNSDKTFINDYSAKDKRDSFDETMNEALQAIYEMPLATYQYNRNYESDINFKRYFGIIVEQIANTSKKFESSTDIENKTTVDNLKYVYTEDEAKSIAEYLNIMTDDNEGGLNSYNAIGILLKAAKETQERLLNLEVSTYGKDSPTLPGNDVVNDKLSIDQKSTVAGLNRLVKALCREVFQDANPTDIDNKGAWSANGENYSRLDMLDKEVNGENAKEDTQQRIALADVSTYPDDASITQTIEYTYDKVADSENDNDFDNVDYLNKATYDEVDSSSDKFDGLNDAVNRIVAKLNQLTTNVNGSDEIKNRPLMLDYIRQTLETLLKEVYDTDNEEVNADTLTAGAFTKTGVSRIDRIVESLFNFDLSIGTTKYGKAGTSYNGKKLKGEKENVNPDTNSFETFKANSPESLKELNETASIIDVIIDLLAGDEKQLSRTDAVSWSDRNVNSAGYKESKKDDVEGYTYNPVNDGHLSSNELWFNNKTVIDRLNDIEKALQLLSLKTQNKLDFNSISVRNNSTPFAGVTSTDDFFNVIAQLFGITFEKDGFYGTKRDTTVVAENIKNIKEADNKKTELNLYNIIYDTVTRIKNVESNLAYDKTLLGPDYENYNRTKQSYEALGNNDGSYEKDYSVTSDMQALLKLLYGKDDATTESDNNTTYAHFKSTEVQNDNFTHSPIIGGVSALDSLFTMLYNVPRIRSNTENKPLDLLSGYRNLQYDYAAPKSTTPVEDSNSSLLGRGRRTKFIAQSGDDVPLNRIDILEKGVQSLYRFVGLGSNEHNNYYDGIFTFQPNSSEIESQLWGGNETNKGHGVLINGKDYDVRDRFYEMSGNYQTSSIALQAYYNTIDIADLVTEKNSNGRISVKYAKAVRTSEHFDTPEKMYNGLSENKVDSLLGTQKYESYSICTTIKKLIEWSDKLDKGIIDVDKKLIIEIDDRKANERDLWKSLGSDYTFKSDNSNTITKRLTAIETYVDIDNNTESLSKRMTSCENDIIQLREELGNNKGSKTVYDRLDDIERTNGAVLKSLKNVDDDTADFTTANDEVYKNLSGSTAKESDSDADDVVLATKTSVESLVSKAVAELQTEMTTAIQNNRKLAALMAYMKCDDIKASKTAVQFVRSGGSMAQGFDMQEDKCIFNASESSTGKLEINDNAVIFCGENMIKIILDDYVDHLKFECFVPYDPSITNGTTYENQTQYYGNNTIANSLDEDTYTVRIYNGDEE